MHTQDGYIKRCETSEFNGLKSGSIALKLKDFDRVVPLHCSLVHS